MSVKGKRIVLGVTGGIAAFKAASICSQLKQRGAEVRVIMTDAAKKFIQPLTFQTLSGHHVYTDTFEEADPAVVAHIDLADHADLFLIVPATANMMAKLANGLADDMLSTTLLATESLVWMAPAMNGHMYHHPAVQRNMNTLRERGVYLMEPGEGLLACGYVGRGRLPEPEDIVKAVERYFSTAQAAPAWWSGKRVLVTAGPTRENLDPVRYISNYSSGKMGYALAESAYRAGAKVTLVTGPVSIHPPAGVEVVPVASTEEMFTEVSTRFKDVDVVFKAAAVVDYQPVDVTEQKIKKAEDLLTITFRKTTDILQSLGERKERQILVGFAAETTNVEKYALKKLKSKNLDFVIANDVTQEGAGFGTETNIVTVYDRSGEKIALPKLDKLEVANEILRIVQERVASD